VRSAWLLLQEIGLEDGTSLIHVLFLIHDPRMAHFLQVKIPLCLPYVFPFPFNLLLELLQSDSPP